MVYNKSITLMMNNGYQVMGSNIPCLTLLFQSDESNDRMNIVGLIKNTDKIELTSEQLDNVSFQIERKFLIGQYAKEVNILYLIFTDNIERDKSYAEGKSKFWLMDVIGKRIVVFEEQPDDFYGLRNLLTNVYDETNQYNEYNRKRKKILPIVTFLLIIINVIIYILLEQNGSTKSATYMLGKGASFGKLIFDNHEYYRLFTAMFMHFGFAHLLNNMLALWILGSKLETMMGNVQFVILYILSGLIGGIASGGYYYFSDKLVVSAGASGAIYGVLGAIVVLSFIQRKRNDKSILFRMGFVLILMFYGSGTQGVDNVAHIGGFVGGVIIMFIYKIISDKHSLSKLKNH